MTRSGGRGRVRWRALACAAAVALAEARAEAQRAPPGAGVPWVPALSVDHTATPYIEGTGALEHGQVSVGLTAVGTSAPVRVPTGALGGTLVDPRLEAVLRLSFGVARYVGLGVQIPVVLFQDAQREGVASAGVGDVRLMLRVTPMSAGDVLAPSLPPANIGGDGRFARRHGFGFGFDLAGTAPTAGSTLSGHGAFTAQAGFSLEYRYLRTTFGFRASYLARFGDDWPRPPETCALPDPGCPLGLPLRDRLDVSFMFRHPEGWILYAIGRGSRVLADVSSVVAFAFEETIGIPYVSFGISWDVHDFAGGPSVYEIGYGTQRRFGPVTFSLGGASSVAYSPAGRWRAFFGVQWQSAGDGDRDGVGDDEDLCPAEPGTRRMRGCAEEHDDDGIDFPTDQCPDLPGRVENHGCPASVPAAPPIPTSRQMEPQVHVIR